jgi:2-haloacid dehalogenase
MATEQRGAPPVVSESAAVDLARGTVCDHARMLSTVLLDVNGTLTDTSPIGEVWDRPELGDRVLQQAASTAVVQALLDTAERPFVDHLRAAIEVVIADADLDPRGFERAVAAAASLPARPGAGEALKMLRRAGLRLVALTNSGADGGRRTLEGCGLAPFVDLVLGVDAVGTFKPHPGVYAYALSQLGDDYSRVAMIATHPWDLAGAAHGGVRTGWVRHGTRVWPAVFPRPDVQAETLPELATELLALT